jgi:Zinc knuckle
VASCSRHLGLSSPSQIFGNLASIPVDPAVLAQAYTLIQSGAPVKPTDTCLNCGQKGHWAKDCPQQKKSSNGTNSRRSAPSSSSRTNPIGVPMIPTLGNEFLLLLANLEPRELAEKLGNGVELAVVHQGGGPTAPHYLLRHTRKNFFCANLPGCLSFFFKWRTMLCAPALTIFTVKHLIEPQTPK